MNHDTIRNIAKLNKISILGEAESTQFVFDSVPNFKNNLANKRKKIEKETVGKVREMRTIVVHEIAEK